MDELIVDMKAEDKPPEVHSLARTLERWKGHIIAWHTEKLSNGPTEAMNNLVKRVKRAAFGFRTFRNFRVRSLLYAGRPNWHCSPRSNPVEIRSATNPQIPCRSRPLLDSPRQALHGRICPGHR